MGAYHYHPRSGFTAGFALKEVHFSVLVNTRPPGAGGVGAEKNSDWALSCIYKWPIWVHNIIFHHPL